MVQIHLLSFETRPDWNTREKTKTKNEKVFRRAEVAACRDRTEINRRVGRKEGAGKILGDWSVIKYRTDDMGK